MELAATAKFQITPDYTRVILNTACKAIFRLTHTLVADETRKRKAGRNVMNNQLVNQSAQVYIYYKPHCQ